MQRFRTEDSKPWSSLSIKEVAFLFANASFLWWIAGGYAIEQFVGSTVRPHDDIDVLMLRRDASIVRNLLADWDLWMVDLPRQLQPWPKNETLPLRVSDVWCRKHSNDPWRFQLMLDDADEITTLCSSLNAY